LFLFVTVLFCALWPADLDFYRANGLIEYVATQNRSLENITRMDYSLGVAGGKFDVTIESFD